jgi:putative hemolysin
MPGDPFDLDLPTDTPLRRAAARAAQPLLQWALRLDVFRELYARANSLPASAAGGTHRDRVAFATAALRVLDVRVEGNAVEEIPAQGPLIVAANHPHGALDGLALLDVIGRVRPDVRLVANHLLACIPELRDLCFFIDPFERRDSVQRSLAGLRAAHLWLRRGGTLLIFPAGEVAHCRRADGTVVDSPWRPTVGRLARGTSARILPASIDGANSRHFYILGRIHSLFRTVLLPRELLNSRGSSVSVRFGRVLNANELLTDEDTADSITQRIRDAVEAIRRGARPSHAQRAPGGARFSFSDTLPGAPIARDGRRESPKPVVPPIDPARLDQDVRELPAAARLLTTGAFDVYCAEAAQIPHVLQEIGRLRESSFRAVGEGTGRPSDLDSFDQRYLHLFVWNQSAREVVGAYRIGRADEIVAASGVDGLYTRTLFRFDARLLNRLPPALELGRSFVRAEYQRDYSALLLLWKGICGFVQRHPRYRVLFGAVSISARYNDRTRDMLMRFLEQNHLHQQVAELVSSLHPYSPMYPRHDASAAAPRTVEEADALVSQLEKDGRGMPVLLRQYLKLNARVLGFNVDPSFGDALDALMMADLVEVDARILRRYFGAAGARTLLEYHASTSHAA